MTEREWRLRNRIDRLVEQRDTLRRMVGSRPKRQFRECVYCGRFTYGKACDAHKDLIQLDPSMGGGA